jgi:membrane protease YdiL (CAAX protease family)
MRDQAERETGIRKTFTFLVLAFGISWTTWIAAYRFGARPSVGEEFLAFGSAGPALAAILLSRTGKNHSGVGPAPRTIYFLILWIAGWAVYVLSDKARGAATTVSPRFVLAIAILAIVPAAVATAAFSRDTGIRRLLRTLAIPHDWRWPAIAFFFFPAILLVPTAILHAAGFAVVWQRGGRTLGALAVYGSLTFLRNLLFTSFFEEPGWRGFLLPGLQKKFSPLAASLLVWLPWALWHAPLDFTGGVGSNLANYIQVRVVFLIPITIIMTWFYNRSGRSILCTALFHAGMNTFPFVLPYVPLSLALIFVFAIYTILADRMWRRKEEAGAPVSAIAPA